MQFQGALFQYNNVSQLPSVVGGGALTFTKLETIPKGKVRGSLKLSRKGKFDWNHITKPNTPSPAHVLERKVFILRRSIVCGGSGGCHVAFFFHYLS